MGTEDAVDAYRTFDRREAGWPKVTHGVADYGSVAPASARQPEPAGGEKAVHVAPHRRMLITSRDDFASCP
ncbi:hypothetical protein GCM10022232_38740 [Streptomyces plumbiresistens]|uniref:Uncharacterized protein n=1 Tax=Streptomyces plumbiresistens TaxID=511811 RepID=A0ABP7RI88_9ACTN